MTTCYQWAKFPDEFSVKCPNCESESKCSNAPVKIDSNDNGAQIDQLRAFEGDISCLNCGLKKRKIIHWPTEAFWTFSIKGKLLWAWNLEHTKVLLDFLESNERNQKGYPGYFSSLLHLPRHFKLSKNREAAIKAIKQRLKVIT